MKRFSLTLVTAALGAAALVAGAEASSFGGTVVDRDAHARTLAVAAPNGLVRTIHVRRLASVGALVHVRAARLEDGTFRADGVRVLGRSHRALISGTVVRSLGGRTLLSAGGTILAVRGRRHLDPGRRVHGEIEIEHGQLRSGVLRPLAGTGRIELEGVVTSLSPLTIRVAGTTIPIAVPAASAVPASVGVGDEIEALVDFRSGVYTLVRFDDRGAREAEPGDDRGGTREAEPGDDSGGRGEPEPGDDHGGSGRGGDDGPSHR